MNIPNKVKNILSDNQTVSYLGKYRLTKSADYSRINYNNIYDVYMIFSTLTDTSSGYIAYRNNQANFFTTMKELERIK